MSMKFRSRTLSYSHLSLLLALLPTVLNAAVTGSSLRAFTHATWGQRDGAPQGIRALTQTTDGYLWVGTTAGLLRFDGSRFSVFSAPAGTPQLRSLDITCLTADSNSGIWIGYRAGGISYLQNGSLSNFDERAGLPSEQVTQILPAKRDEVWAVAGGKLLKLSFKTWKQAGLSFKADTNNVRTIFFDTAGDLWVNAGNHLYKVGPAQRAPVMLPNSVREVTQFAEAPDGSVWIVDAWTCVRRVSDASGPGWSMPLRGAASILFDSHHNLWVAHDYYGVDIVPASLWSRDSTETPMQHLDDDQGLTSSDCSALLEDNEKNIWVSTSRGLDRFASARFEPFTHTNLRSFAGVAASPSGELWVASWGRPLMQITGANTVSDFGPRRGWGVITVDRTGTVWAYDYWLRNIWKLHSGSFEQIPLSSKLQGKVVQSIASDDNNRLIAAFEGVGVWRWEQARWTRVRAPGAPARTPLCLYPDQRGKVWFGYADGQVAVVQNGKATVFPVGKNKQFGSVMTLCRENNRLWVGGTNGLAVFTGTRFRLMPAAEGFELRGISGIVADRSGNLWLNGAQGVTRISAMQLNRALKGENYPLQGELFDYRDGVSGAAAQLRPTPSAVADSSGRIWFATDGNLVSVASSATAIHQPLQSVVIEAVRTEHKTLQVNTTRSITIGRRNLEIDYIGISLSSPQRVTYRYKLDGEDGTWQDVGARRQAFYSSLNPGHYRFHVAASVGDGCWTERTLPVELIVQPAFYQTVWFFSACVMATVLLLGMAYRLRIRHHTQRLEDRLEERAAERVRLARDLHDTLLQGVQGLLLRLRLTAEHIPPHQEGYTLLEQAIGVADRVVKESRDRVRGLRPELSGREFTKALLEIGEELNWRGDVEFAVTSEGAIDDVSLSVRSELYFIAREAITNAFRHSDASKIGVEISSLRSLVRLSCFDNGCGMRRERVNRTDQRHWGFIGMRERAEKIGADFQYVTAPGEGTTITISLYKNPAGWRSRVPSRASEKVLS